MTMILCRKCKDVFNIPSRRGRPPVECSTCRNGKSTIPKPEPKPEPQLNIKPQIERPQSDNVMMLFCHGCKDVFAIPARKGRPPKFCKKCAIDAPSDAEETRARLMELANKRVDNLEMLLKSRHMHISQHRDKW